MPIPTGDEVNPSNLPFRVWLVEQDLKKQLQQIIFNTAGDVPRHSFLLQSF